MIEGSEQELGPIDWVVIDFPVGERHFGGDMARELESLVEAELIRVLDLAIVTKGTVGDIEVTEFEDLDGAAGLRGLEGQLAEVLAMEDLEHVAETMEPGETAGVLVWENRWAAPFAAAARQSGGQLVASGRIPTQAFIAAINADTGGD